MGRFTRAELGVVATAALLVFSRVLGLSLVLPNFRGHYASAFGAPSVWIGTAFGAYGLTMALMQYPMGALSDHFGRRRVLVGGGVLFILGSVGAAFAPNVGALIVARLVQGLGAVSSTAMAAVGETVAPERRTLAMALVGIPAGGGFLVGMGLGPALYPLISMQGLFLVTAGLGGLAVLQVLRTRLPDPHPHLEGTHKALGLPVIGLAMAGFTTNFFLTTTLFHLPETDWRHLLPMLSGALLFILLLSRPIDKAGLTWQPVAAALVLLAVVAPLFALSDGGWQLWAGGVAFFGVHSTLSMVLPSQVSRVSGRQGGRGHGMQNVVAYLGTFVAGPVAGLFAETPEVAFGIAGGVAVLAALLVTAGARIGATATAEPA